MLTQIEFQSQNNSGSNNFLLCDPLFHSSSCLDFSVGVLAYSNSVLFSQPVDWLLTHCE